MTDLPCIYCKGQGWKCRVDENRECTMNECCGAGAKMCVCQKAKEPWHLIEETTRPATGVKVIKSKRRKH